MFKILPKVLLLTLLSLGALVAVYCVFRVYKVFIWKGDFYHFYMAAQAIIAGNDLYASGVGGYIYPPFFAFLITPLTHFSIIPALAIYQSMNVILLAIILILGIRTLESVLQIKLNSLQISSLCALTFILTNEQIWEEFSLAQSDLLILAGFCVALYLIDSKPKFAGICLGIIANIKYQSFFFLPFLLLRARWKVIWGFFIGVVLAAMLPALIIGWNRNLGYLLIALKGILTMPGENPLISRSYAARVPEVTWGNNVTFTSGLSRVFLAHGLPKYYLILLICTIATLMITILTKFFHSRNIPFIWRTPETLGNSLQEKAIFYLEWNILLLGMVAFSPQGILRHFIYILNVNMFLSLMLLFPISKNKNWFFWLGTLVAEIAIMNNGTFLLVYPHSSGWNYYAISGWGLLILLPVLTKTGLDYCIILSRRKIVSTSPTEDLTHSQNSKISELV